MNRSDWQVFTYYRLPTKLQEGNVLTSICLDVHRGVEGWVCPGSGCLGGVSAQG